MIRDFDFHPTAQQDLNIFQKYPNIFNINFLFTLKYTYCHSIVYSIQGYSYTSLLEFIFDFMLSIYQLQHSKNIV